MSDLTVLLVVIVADIAITVAVSLLLEKREEKISNDEQAGNNHISAKKSAV